MARKQILVVDDDAYVRNLVIKILNGRGFHAIPAVDPWQAMDQLQQQSIDLIVLDLRMPGPVDGEQFLFTLQDQGNTIPVIVVSGWVDEEMSCNPPDCVRAILKKPVHVDSFADTVATILDGGSVSTS